MRVIWAPAARQDLGRIDDYLADRDAEFARVAGRAALTAAEFLSVNPFAGSPIARTRRKWRVNGSPYLLVYRIRADIVEILRIRHEREDWRSQP
ncbi:type II toxin-antitoxin system RelE/ParE family toxin [Sphingomonas sp. Y38-1Y]|uniref:type II toxin-antitoxin system RelE/ParE family toxin n=1 Tax=Sphingomonas sp. Y38-1Y TaxID=3078265 RepID=UPI0028EDF4AD|nr:type II toxin-antitoxin system RelE/ParE family toxin [Sphingomonas sp. Y38-1Y]